MKSEQINIRDPYVLLSDETYYLYGTRAKTCWTSSTGFDCYTSKDLTLWDGPFEVFHKPENFFADRNCWAPEVHLYKGSYYMFATFKDTKAFGGTAVLKADHPLGPFHLHSQKQITPLNWECIDGTFYLSPDGTPYMVFVHEWVQISDGSICAVELSKDLSHAVSEPKLLFHASEAKSWVVTIENKNRPGKHYVTDGPFLYRTMSGRLLMLWSSFGLEGYTQAIAYSDNGDIDGNWIQEDKLLFEKDGGHGMLFKDKNESLLLTLHTPNEHLLEHPVFYQLEEQNHTLSVRGIYQ